MSPPPADRSAPPSPAPPAKKFPDFVPPTKIQYDPTGIPRLHLRRCKLQWVDAHGQDQETVFDQGEVKIGAMEDNDLVLRDETVSRYHCKIVQEDQSYLLVDLGSTNGTFI